jgi:cholesterol transport system auxiliary component
VASAPSSAARSCRTTSHERDHRDDPQTDPAAPLLAPLALSLSACVNIGTKVPGTLMSLTPESAPAAGAGASGNLAGATAVLEPAAEARLAVLRIPVQIDDPTSPISRARNGSNGRRGCSSACWPKRCAPRAAGWWWRTTLASAGRAFRAAFSTWAMTRSRRVIVRFDAVKELPGGKIETKRFEQDVPGVAPEASEVGPALNKAANAVAKDVVDWFG